MRTRRQTCALSLLLLSGLLVSSLAEARGAISRGANGASVQTGWQRGYVGGARHQAEPEGPFLTRPASRANGARANRPSAASSVPSTGGPASVPRCLFAERGGWGALWHDLWHCPTAEASGD